MEEDDKSEENIGVSNKAVVFKVDDEEKEDGGSELDIYRPNFAKQCKNIKLELYRLTSEFNLLFSMVYVLLILNVLLFTMQIKRRPDASIEGQCHVKALDKTNWTFYQKFNLTSPSDAVYGISCYHYDFNYSYLATLPYEDALKIAKRTSSKAKLLKCQKYFYKGNMSKSYYLITEYDLMCERPPVQSLVIFTVIGQAVACFLAGILADIHGRRSVFIFGAICSALAYCVIPAAPNLGIIITGKLIFAIGAGSVYLSLLVIFTELCRNKYRSCLTIILHTACQLSEILAHAMVNNGMSWRLTEACFGFPYMITLYGIMFVPESPRWLMVKMQWKRAWEVLHDMGSTKEEAIVHVPIFKPISPAKQLRIFSKKYFQRRTAFSMFIYGVGALSYVITCMLLLFIKYSFNTVIFVLSVSIPKKEPLRLKLIISKSLFKTTALVITAIVARRKTKRCICSTMFLLLSGCFVTIIATQSDYVNDIVEILAEVFSVIGYIVAEIYVMEMFPTTYRATVLGVNLAFSRCITLFYFYYKDQMRLHINVHFLQGSFSSIFVIGVVVAMFAPTTYEEIPDTRLDLQRPLELEVERELY